MFSANENLMLRQHKRRIVEEIEATIPEEALDEGTTVMVMQVSCKAPGCVPLETAVIVVFPKSSTELIPGLPESKDGGNYKTKILKPMAEVTHDDILEALPPAFEGGRRTMEKLCRYARDVMLAQITQLFGEEEDSSIPDRQAMAEYLQAQLQTYIANQCKPPELGEDFPTNGSSNGSSNQVETQESKVSTSSSTTSTPATNGTTDPSSTTAFPKGNLVIRRVVDEPAVVPKTTPAPISGIVGTMNGAAKHQRAIQHSLVNPMQSSNISKLFEREHAPGVRQAGCPCCDPDNPSNLVDNMMML